LLVQFSMRMPHPTATCYGWGRWTYRCHMRSEFVFTPFSKASFIRDLLERAGWFITTLSRNQVDLDPLGCRGYKCNGCFDFGQSIGKPVTSLQITFSNFALIAHAHCECPNPRSDLTRCANPSVPSGHCMQAPARWAGREPCAARGAHVRWLPPPGRCVVAPTINLECMAGSACTRANARARPPPTRQVTPTMNDPSPIPHPRVAGRCSTHHHAVLQALLLPSAG
jgi:hypothetical protein